MNSKQRARRSKKIEKMFCRRQVTASRRLQASCPRKRLPVKTQDFRLPVKKLEKLNIF